MSTQAGAGPLSFPVRTVVRFPAMIDPLLKPLRDKAKKAARSASKVTADREARDAAILEAVELLDARTTRRVSEVADAALVTEAYVRKLLREHDGRNSCSD